MDVIFKETEQQCELTKLMGLQLKSSEKNDDGSLTRIYSFGDAEIEVSGFGTVICQELAT